METETNIIPDLLNSNVVALHNVVKVPLKIKCRALNELCGLEHGTKGLSTSISLFFKLEITTHFIADFCF